MPRRPSSQGYSEDLLPDDRRQWAEDTWRDREEVARLPGGAWMLRNAAELLGLPEEAVDELLSAR